MDPEQSRDAFETLIASRGLEVADLDATQAVDAMLSFYVAHRATGIVNLDEDGDMVLFEFGLFDFGDGPSFQFGLVRQFVLASVVDDHALTQLQLVLYYEPSGEATDLGDGNVWCRHPDEVSEFRSVIESSNATRFVRDRTATRVALRYEHV